MPTYKDEKRGTWYTVFYYTDWTGQRKQKKKRGFKRERDAKAYERSFLEKAAASPDMTFNSLYDLYMADCKTRLRPTTYANKVFIIETHILPYFRTRTISSITPADVRQWQNKLLGATYDKRGRNNQTPMKYTPTYLKTIHNQITAMFNYACKYYHLGANPARLCGSMGKKNADKINFWTLEQFNQFISIYDNDLLAKAAFSTLFWTGCRIGELLALTKGDIDFTEGTMAITKSYARLDGRDIIQPPKTPKSIRTVTLPPFLVSIIQDYISSLYELQDDQRLFECTKHLFEHKMKHGADWAGLPCIRLHDLRHSHASLLIEQGFSPLLIKERLGHENIETTLNTYSHLYPNKQGELSDRLQNLGTKKGRKRKTIAKPLPQEK